MLGLRLTALALLAAGCGNADLDVGVLSGALASCNDVNDCSVPGGSGGCVGVQCAGHSCQYITDTTACTSGCTVAATDCQVTGACNTIPCKAADTSHATAWCDFNDYTVAVGCGCQNDTTCAASANSCQQNGSCQAGTCTYEGKPPVGASCCNVDADCGTGKCTNNICGCTGSGKKYCPGSAADGRCVPNTGCCVPSDCAAGNTCQTRTCSTAGACGYVSNGNAGCCDMDGDCGGTATCANNTCSCGTGMKFCTGSSPGAGSCIPTSGCCVDADCAARAHATASCNSNACVYTCTTGFHDCSGVCNDDTSVATCGNLCTACPAGNSCQTATCNGTTCGFGAAGASPCCNSPSDCTPGNACQQATACDNNMCVFGSTGADGCCNKADDCMPPADECLAATCVANQCATAPVVDCVPDGGVPDGGADDLATPPVGDLAGIKLSGGGGCALGGRAAPRVPALFVVALALLAVSLRRRSA